MRGNLTIVDKKTEFGTFRYEERIKLLQFRENIDYTFDEVKSIYTILSPQLAKDVLIIQNPYNENIDVSDIVVKVLVDYESEINVKPQIVLDLERRKGLIETGRGVNNFTRSLPPGRTPQIIKDGESNSSQIQEINDSVDVEMSEVENPKETKKDDDRNGGGVNKYTTIPFTFLLFFLVLF